jgi:hypothetical protein
MASGDSRWDAVFKRLNSDGMSDEGWKGLGCHRRKFFPLCSSQEKVELSRSSVLCLNCSSN